MCLNLLDLKQKRDEAHSVIMRYIPKTILKYVLHITEWAQSMYMTRSLSPYVMLLAVTIFVFFAELSNYTEGQKKRECV